ncbi:MAG: GCN5-related N-acetyltransferase [Gemmatimonadetes bacterium]|jgi:GNAT superfamily N-acetyltransferase|nr:GCN5-related N-acetyltransferase [Gemmatimonadota bacterium]
MTTSLGISSARAERSSATRVREATPRDLDAVIRLRLALLREHPDHPIYGRLRRDVTDRARELFATQLRSTMEVILLAEVDDDVAGILRCVESIGSPLLDPARYAYVSSVYVRPDRRRRGVLTALVRAAERWARARGLDQMRLHNVAGSAMAEAAWSALGFEVVEQVRVRPLPSTRPVESD